MQDMLTSGLIDLLLAMTTIAGGALIAAIRRHFSLRAIAAAEAVARIAVRAAEQMAEAAGWDSAAKLTMALAGARDLAAAHGVTLSDAQWRQLIEREVALLRRLDRELTAPDSPPIGAYGIRPDGTPVEIAAADADVTTVPNEGGAA